MIFRECPHEFNVIWIDQGRFWCPEDFVDPQRLKLDPGEKAGDLELSSFVARAPRDDLCRTNALEIFRTMFGCLLLFVWFGFGCLVGCLVGWLFVCLFYVPFQKLLRLQVHGVRATKGLRARPRISDL